MDIGKQISFAGLEIVNAIDENHISFQSCFDRVNATVIDPKSRELINKVNDVCSKA